MKTMLTSVLVITSTLLSGCTEKATKINAAQESADAKARSDALKKEMETAPKVFSNRDIFKKNEPAGTAPAPANTESK
jgi:outer membrane murein-binding lipoprotein Lpp